MNTLQSLQEKRSCSSKCSLPEKRKSPSSPTDSTWRTSKEMLSASPTNSLTTSSIINCSSTLSIPNSKNKMPIEALKLDPTSTRIALATPLTNLRAVRFASKAWPNGKELKQTTKGRVSRLWSWWNARTVPKFTPWSRSSDPNSKKTAFIPHLEMNLRSLWIDTTKSRKSGRFLSNNAIIVEG